MTAAARFHAFAPEHLAALAMIAAAAAAVAGAARRNPGGMRSWRVGIALLLIAGQLADPLLAAARGGFSVSHALPLQLCDLSAFVCAAALLRPGPRLFELAYFWGFSGAVQALLTPDLADGWPDPDFVRFFLVHGGIVVGLFLLVVGLGWRPRPGAVWRVYGLTALYTLLVGLLNYPLGANYFYLREKPSGGSLLDLFPGWPWYIAGGALVGAILFWLLDLPFRLSRRRS